MDDKHQYFVVKAPRENLEISFQTGLWATQRNNEQKLVNAYHEGPVVLLFSAIKSNRFAGYALMTSLPNSSLRAQWKCPNHIELSDCFRVQWKAMATLSFGDKPYFDCQKLPSDVGRRLCEQMDEIAQKTGGSGPKSQPHPASREAFGSLNGPVEPPTDPMLRMPRMQPTRFFVAKAPPEVLQQSLVHGIWATSGRASTAKLVEAFYQGRVILLLSSVRSNFLHGFCRMQGLPDEQWVVDWGLPRDQQMGPPFEVKWYCSCELMSHEVNPWNNNKPITKCADCTELPPELGNDLCQWMWEQGEPVTGHKPPIRSGYEAGYAVAPGYGPSDVPDPMYDPEYVTPEGDGDWPRAYGRISNLMGYDDLLEYDYMDPQDRFVDGPSYGSHGMGMGSSDPINGTYTTPNGHDDQWPLHEPGTRYFVIRAPRSSFETSLETGLWATQQANEARLVAAYEQGPVVLLFCPVNSSKLQGYGVMQSLPSNRHHADWQAPSHVALGDSFQVQWKCVATVGVGRIYFDGEELAPQVGYRYCQRLLAAERKEREAFAQLPGGKLDKKKGAKKRIGKKGEGGLTALELDDAVPELEAGEFGVGMTPSRAAITQPLSQATRFFVVRTNMTNLQESLRRWVWVVGRRTQSNLSSAFRDGRVMLLFAPTGCDRYLGFMKMIGMPGTGSPVNWIWDGPGEQGDFFGVSWYCLCDIDPPEQCAPGHDLQELTADVGNELCQMMWENGHTAPKPELVCGDMDIEPMPFAPHPDVSCGTPRYFVVKAPKANIIISQSKGVWATHHRRQPALLAAASEAPVYLLFSALSTQRFQGYASILGGPGPGTPPAPWECSKRVAASLGECFPVRWMAICNETSDEVNPWNGNKPVWDCKDCQEVPPEVGERLCQTLEGAAT